MTGVKRGARIKLTGRRGNELREVRSTAGNRKGRVPGFKH